MKQISTKRCPDLCQHYLPKTYLNDLHLRRFRKRVAGLLDDFERTLTRNVPQARQAMRKLRRDENGNFMPLEFSPTMINGEKALDFNGRINAGSVLHSVGAENPFSTLYNESILPLMKSF